MRSVCRHLGNDTPGYSQGRMAFSLTLGGDSGQAFKPTVLWVLKLGDIRKNRDDAYCLRKSTRNM